MEKGTTDSFRFLRGIIISSILTVALLGSYSVFFLAPSFSQLIAQNTEAEAIRIGRYMAGMLFESGKELDKTAITDDFPAKLKEITRNFEMIRIKVFSPNGEIIFSTRTDDIGKINQKTYFHNEVSSGHAFTKIVSKNTKSLEGQLIQHDVVETYVPVMDGKRFLGAFEIYFDITTSKAKLDRLVIHANIILLLVTLGLLLAVAIIAGRARKNIHAKQRAEEKIIHQSANLKEINSELSVLNEISAVISRSIDMEQLLPRILKTIGKHLHFYVQDNMTCIFLFKDDNLELAAETGHDPGLKNMHENGLVNQCLCGQTARSGEIMFQKSSTGESRGICCGTDIAHGHIIIPLKASNVVVGVLNIQTPTGIEAENKKHLFASIGNQLGVALENTMLYEETKRLSMHDPLTGLANRRYMEKNLAQSMAQAMRYNNKLSICMLDIDFFKKYNDTMGHAAGDELLKKAADIIQHQLRKADLAARYGGEEFMVIMPATDIADAITVAERIREQIASQTDVTISIGVSEFNKAEMNRDNLVQAADRALYKAKENGRNRVERA